MQALFALLSLKFFQKAIGMSHVIEKFNSSTMYQLPINYIPNRILSFLSSDV